MLREVEVTLTPTVVFAADALLLLFFSLSLSFTLSQAVQVFYARGDLDLLLSSPLPARRVLAVRCLAMAVASIALYLLLATPVLAVVVGFGHWRWLNVYPVLVSVGLLATSLGLVLAMALFALLGPQRTRTVSQILAAFLGAGFFLAVQLPNMTGDGDSGRLLGFAQRWIDSDAFSPDGVLAWPARAALGETGPALVMLALSATTPRPQRGAKQGGAGRRTSARWRASPPVCSPRRCARSSGCSRATPPSCPRCCCGCSISFRWPSSCGAGRARAT
jgi:ABC-2 type transport system permease protein